MEWPWALTLLGTPTLHAADGRQWRPERKTAILLAYLALEGSATRARLAELLWPDTPPHGARNNLVHLLRRLSRLCGADLVHGHAALTLDGGVRVDARALLEPPGAPADIPAGTLLAGVDVDDLPEIEEWVAAWREDLDGRRRERLVHAAQAAEDAGEWTHALRHAGQLLDLDPASEDALRRVMRLHAHAGDRPAALAAYARGRELLARELGSDPEPQTRDLARRIEADGALPGVRRAATLPLGVLRPPVLVGRAAAWAQLEAAWAAGHTIYVTGDAGAGKTRLAQDFVASRGRALFLPGRAGAQDVPFAAAAHNARARLAAAPDVTLPEWARRELSRLLPELATGEPPPPIDSEAARLKYYLAHLELVRLTAPGFAAVITDDVQYYDPATVELGAFFLTQSPAPGEPGEVPRHVITYRRGSLPAHTQARIDALVEAGVAARVELGGLDVQGTRDLLHTLDVPGDDPDLPAALHRVTGGNPQFLLEALRHMFRSGDFRVDERLHRPEGVRPLVEERLAGLSGVALQVARGAAVLGDHFTLELLAEVLGLGVLNLAGAWEELETAQVTVGERFSHDVVREAVLAGLPDTVRTLLHRAAARTLERHGEHPGRVARHWQAAGDHAQAAAWLMRAGAAAEADLRPSEAAAAYAAAVGAYAAQGDDAGADAARRAGAAVGGDGGPRPTPRPPAG
ncbi:DNA-binding SARP family transcriptional activator [Deinococcus metalli]|uniref:DNA-binding SARP family transcriptional activator n=1 Tax=Deinococcus metalli TaxID=1141878 RepID=A0A7W8NRF1_9DEIO|nr:BTAD domain-containing putative transcriptional regulator [Deinococcus metalli]MBB5376818.1 DNA-binding SARP family transcriptional activator [Deinococcus metalli]GHF45581.1 hypothetical protein GCM10017781_22470 [Deinococcus metalli]